VAWRRCVRPAAIAILLLDARPGAAAATETRAALGYDYSSGPGGVVSRGVLGVGALGLGDRALATLAVTRYDDGEVGMGTGVTGGLAVAAGSSAFLRGWASRYTGEASYSAWRLKAGPQVDLPRSAKLGLYYTHDEDNAAARSNALAAELDVPIVEGVAGRASTSYASLSGGLRSEQGSVGLGWTLRHTVELLGDVGLAQDGAAVAGGPVHHGLDPLGVLGHGHSSESGVQRHVSFTSLVGLRVWLH